MEDLESKVQNNPKDERSELRKISTGIVGSIVGSVTCGVSFGVVGYFATITGAFLYAVSANLLTGSGHFHDYAKFIEPAATYGGMIGAFCGILRGIPIGYIRGYNEGFKPK